MDRTGQNRLEDGHKPARDVAEGMRRADIVEAFATALWPDIQPWQRAALRAAMEKDRPIGGTSRLAAETPDEAVDALVAQLEEQRTLLKLALETIGDRPHHTPEAMMVRIRKHADVIYRLKDAMDSLLIVTKRREPVAMDPDPKWFDDTGLPQEPARDTPQYWQEAYFVMQAQIDRLRNEVDLAGTETDATLMKLQTDRDHTDRRVAALEARLAQLNAACVATYDQRTNDTGDPGPFAQTTT